MGSQERATGPCTYALQPRPTHPYLILPCPPSQPSPPETRAPSTTLHDPSTSGPSTRVDASPDYDPEKASPRTASLDAALFRDPFLFRDGVTSEDELLRLRRGTRGAKKIARYQLKQNAVSVPPSPVSRSARPLLTAVCSSSTACSSRWRNTRPRRRSRRRPPVCP